MARNRSKLIAGLSVLGLMGTAACPAYAQDAGDETRASAGSDIVVTARKREENPINVPIAISAFSSEEITRSGATGLRDIAAMTPGLTFQDVNGAYAAPTIRGVSQIDQTSLQGNVGVFIDGVYLNNRTGLEFGMLELNRLEVAKGPQAALYGRNTFAGAINYITVQPQLGEVSGKVSAEIGNRGRQTYKGGVNVPIGDHAAARIFGGWGKFDGTIKNERTGNYIGGYDGNYAYGINLLIEPTDRLQINLFGMYSRVSNRAVPLEQRPTSENNCGSETVWNGTTFYTLYCGPLEKITSVDVDENVGYGLRGSNKLAYGTIAYDLDFATLSATASYAKAAYSQLVDTTSDRDAINIPTVGTRSRQSFVSALSPDSTDKAVDVRLQSNDGSPLSYSLGFYGYNSDITNVTAVSAQPVGEPDSEPIAFSTNGGRIVSRGRSIYGSLGYEITPAFNVTAELRWTHEKQKFNGVGASEFYNGTRIVGEQSFSYWTPRFTANYELQPDLVAYASIAKGAKTGGFNSNAFEVQPELFTYGLETNWTYEVGLKGRVLDNKLRFNADVYYIDWKAIQGQRGVTGTPLSVVSNLGDARVKGIEGDLTYYITPEFSISAAGSISDPKYRDGFIDGDLSAACGNYPDSTVVVVGCTDEVGGNQIARTSKYQYSLSAAYTVPDLFEGVDAYIRGDYNYMSGKYTAGNEQQNQGSIKLANARVGFVHDGIELSFWMKNIFDYKYADRATMAPSTSDGGRTSGVTYLRNYPGERRTFGMRLDYAF